MKKLFWIPLLFAMACGSILPTPDDFPPPPPMTVIVEIPPTAFATTTLEPRPAMITSESMEEARTFYLILITRVTAGDDVGISEMVRYPIEVEVDGVEVILKNADEFLQNYDKIFNEKRIAALAENNEEDLILLPEGVRAGNSGIWLNLYCTDPACSDTQFLITRIEN